ncbi:MAG TPA: protein kinase, partial [Polyangiaceae bacterium]|nr:protein kinase [Polyangiaceae bacterium]
PGGAHGASVAKGASVAAVHPAGAAAAPGVARLVAVDERPLSAEDCAIGAVVAGKYLIEGVIGRGSMGVVVRATHLGFDELVALKFIRPEMRKIDGIVSRFAREAKASVRIRNEHAVNVLDVGVADPIGPFFVMEYLEGINLEELVDSQGAFDAATAVKYVLEACEALAAAHAQGIIHRDIKPQNMFLAWQGRLELIKVLDFGISKAALRGQVFGDDLSSSENDWVMGTPLYMSPEQLHHAPDVDERTDIWSLGAVLYELLSGQPLFSGDTQTQVCHQVLGVAERPVRLPIPGVPEELWDVVERCLSFDKEQRYGNVAELGEVLLPFAPHGAVLHVERARALLGLRPLDLFEADEIEDIDVDPIDEPQLHEPVAPAPSASPPPQRRLSWLELAVPVLAIAVLWLGFRQGQLDERTSTLQAIETLAFALRPTREPPAAESLARAPAPEAATTRNGAQPASAEGAAPREAGPCPATSAPAQPAPTPPAPTPPTVPPPAASAPSPVPPNPAPAAPLAAASNGVTALPASSRPAPSTPPSTQPASSLGGASAAAMAGARPLEPDSGKPRAEPPEAEPLEAETKLEFRLIEDPPNAAAGASNVGASASVPSLPPR